MLDVTIGKFDWRRGGIRFNASLSSFMAKAAP